MSYIKFENPGSTRYEDRFYPGDKVRSLQNVDFVDGEQHRVGQILDVKKDNCSYYNVMYRYYEKVEQEKSYQESQVYAALGKKVILFWDEDHNLFVSGLLSKGQVLYVVDGVSFSKNEISCVLDINNVTHIYLKRCLESIPDHRSKKELNLSIDNTKRLLLYLEKHLELLQNDVENHVE